MADVKTIQTRLQLKYDTYANWTDETQTGLGANLVLLKGEIGICAIGDTAETGSAQATTNPTVLFKVGDGVTPFKTLKWASALAADVYSWAKSETVVLTEKAETTGEGEFAKTITKQILEFKTGETVNHSIDLSVFATDADVKTITDDLASRIAAVEGALGVDSGSADSVSARLDSAETKLDDILGHEADGDTEAKVGLIDQALTDAKAYTDEQIGTKAEGETTATGIRKEIAEAEASAKAYTDTAVGTINAKDAAQDTAIQANADAIAAEKLAREQADQAINNKIGTVAEGKDVVTMIGDAQTAATNAANGYTDTKVKALADGQVETNRAAIAAIDAAYKAADEALDGRLDTVEAKLSNVSNVMDFIGTREVSVVDGVIIVTPVDEETFNKGDVIVDSDGKEYVYDGEAWHEFGYADANASAISGLQTRMNTAEDAIGDLEAAAAGLRTDVDAKLAKETFNTHVNSDHAKTATEITTEITEAVNGEKTLREAADKVINDKIGGSFTAENTVAAAITAAKQAGDDADAKAVAAGERLNAVEPKVTTLQEIVEGYSTKGSIKTAVDAAAELAQAGVDNAKKAQDEVDALELVVDGVKTTADNAKADLAALTGEGGRIALAEGKITTLQGIVDSGEGKTIRDDVTALQTLTGDASKGNEALRSELTTLQDIVNNETTGLTATKAIADDAKTKAEDAQSRVAAIERDYLKAADAYIFNCGSSTTVVHEQAAN